MHLCTDGVHCRESAGTGPVNLKVVPVTGAALTGHPGPINLRLSSLHPLLYWYEVGVSKVYTLVLVWIVQEQAAAVAGDFLAYLTNETVTKLLSPMWLLRKSLTRVLGSNTTPVCPL